MENVSIYNRFMICWSQKIKLVGWIAALLIVLATISRAADLPNIIDLVFTFLGCGFWVWEGFLIKNKPLIALNLFSVAVVSLGILYYFFS